MSQEKTKPQKLDEYLFELYDLSTRMHGLVQLHNDIQRKLPACHARDMIVGKIRKQVRATDEQIQLTIERLAEDFCK